MRKNKKANEEIEVLDLNIDNSQDETKKNKTKINIFKRLKDNWDDLSKKQKTIIFIVSIIVLLFIIGIVLFLIFNKNNNLNHKEIIIAKDNYRYEDGTLYFVVNNKDIGSYKCKNKDKNLCYVAYENNDDNFDVTKYENSNSNKIRSKIIKNKYVFIFDNKNKNDQDIILYDIKEQKNKGLYKNIKTYSNLDNKVFLINEENKYGVLDFTSTKYKTAIDFKYDYLGIITEDKNKEEIIVATEDNGGYLINYEGDKLTKTLNGEIKNYNKAYVKTMDATGKYILYDYDGNKIVDGLNYIDLLDEYYLAVDNENKLKIYGYDQTKYIEEGISLYNTNYVKVVKKDKNNSKTEYAYTYSLDDKKLILTINNNGEEETTTINLLEGLASKNKKYLSYFNGTLYFYSDENKTTLINSYKCNNPNNITSESSSFEVCTLASDTNEDDNDSNNIVNAASIVPLYNNQFVFIKDGNFINLVDLVNEKVLGTYSSINTYSDANQTEPYILNTNEQFVIAKNKNNKYGLLKINNNSITSIYNFDYDKLEKLNQNILARKDNKYFLLDYNGNKITSEFSGPIRNYTGEYLKIINDNKYYVYDFAGNLIFEDGYKYVELYDTYVGLVDDANHLSVTDYKANLLVNEILKLSSTTYYKAKEGYVNAFSIRKEDNKLIITAATSQNTKKEKARDFIYNLTTKERIN